MSKATYIEAILDYQRGKRALVKEVTGMDLIPDEVALTAEQLDDEKIDRIDKFFEAEMHLGSHNCLHCVVFRERCEECPFTTILDDMCRKSDSLYKRIDELWDKAREKELESGDYNDDDNISTKLWELGEELKDRLA